MADIPWLLRQQDQAWDLTMFSAKRGRDSNRIGELREELQKLIGEELESLKGQTFGGIDEEEMRKQDARLKRIREVSADFLSALKQERLSRFL